MPAAQRAFNAILDDLGILYEAETIFLNGDRWVLIDAYVKSAKVAFEIDGEELHERQKGYDAGRDAWLLRRYGIRTYRFSNNQVFRQPAVIRRDVSRILGCGEV